MESGIRDLNRRGFLKVAAGSAAASAFAPAMKAAPADRVSIGLIGTGGRCGYLARALHTFPDTHFVAMCDVYRTRMEKVAAELQPDAALISDYKALLDRKDIDAVVIGAPDHWHVRMTLDAVAAGKDVYVEKPVTHSVEEGGRLIAGVEQSKRVVATGTQQRSWDHYILAKQFIDGGKLGQVTSVQAWWNQNYLKALPTTEIDRNNLDWKAWLGSAPDQSFTDLKYKRWRFFWDFGGGAFTDLMTHWIDAVQWIMGDANPRVVSATGSAKILKDLECPDTVSASMDYDNFTFTYSGTMVQSLEDGGILFHGTKGDMRLTRFGFDVYDEGTPVKRATDLPEPEITVRSTGDGTPPNLRNWLDCVKSRKLPNSHIRAGVEGARASHLANTAMRQRKTIIT